ncbi:MAG: hypothetical protein U0Q22_12205 [Acidimicrobiales bacterium]
MSGDRVQMVGTIASCGFESGDRFVIGRWETSPVGPTVDVMWARPDGTRVLLAPDEPTATYVTSVYRFDEVRVVPFEDVGSNSPSELHLTAGPLRIRLNAGWRVLWLPDRPLWFTKWVERPVARALLGVHTWGTSPTGVQEWYQARSCRFVQSAAAELDGRELGGSRPLHPACGFGFSESPRRPSIVEVRPTLLGPAGWLDGLGSGGGLVP